MRKVMSFLMRPSLMFLLLGYPAMLHGQSFIEKQGEALYMQQIKPRLLSAERYPDVYALVNTIAANILATGLIPERMPIRVEIMNDGAVNAFALPGTPEAHVIITTGLLQEAFRHGSEAVLAGVIAHEIGHIGHNHSSKAVKTALPLGILAVAGDAALYFSGYSREHPVSAGLIRTGSYGGAAAAIAANSRSHEKQSDDEAIQVLPQLGYDLVPLAQFFSRLSERQMRGDFLGHLVDSHPSPQSRAKKIFAASETQATPTLGDSEEFTRIQDRVLGKRR